LALQALDIYPSDVKMVYHHYPDSELSWKLAEALEAAAEQGKFWELHDKFLEGVPADIDELKASARQIGLDMDRFEEALDNGLFQAKVILAKEEAVSRGVTGVGLFVNGQEYQYSPGTIDDLCSAIDKELERLGK
jgi:protein-disulfide isomerase